MKYAIGIDIGGTKIASGIVNEKGDLIQKEVVKSDPSDKERMFSQVITSVEALLNHSSIPANEIYGIGAGIPGKVDRENGIAVFQNNLPWSNFRFVNRIQEALQIDRVVIDNDVYMAAFAEWKEAGLGEKELFVYITISTGIACAIIQGGQFIRGAGFAGEIGLVPVYAGDRGKHLERLEWTASGPAVQARAREEYGDDSLTAKELFSAFYSGDAKVKQLIDEMASSLTHGVYMIHSLLDPHKIVFGGSVATHNPYLLNVVREKLASYLIEEQKHILDEMDISRLGNEQGVIGAGLRALEL
ncbi:ROK family protein [Virgibacillus dakarensis]|uniref:ROK family protein n=1 Tax=Virgibacillus dakarensis TaxID=1917889 RepID=UPI000B446362|nr:ROK family protein [Virgibacillus dakarensis]MBT2215974.1 ROK family protein [Virgibacillus dakarensis]MTW84394.1 ROK family protein [Virgibacillus dakarensis]